jgi:hypothetical protein
VSLLLALLTAELTIFHEKVSPASPASPKPTVEGDAGDAGESNSAKFHTSATNAPSKNEWESRPLKPESPPQTSHSLGTQVTLDSRFPLLAPETRTKIEAIEADARRLAWPTELLWNSGFWDCPRGLAALLDADDEIAEVTSDYIAILKTKRDLLKFRRHLA